MKLPDFSTFAPLNENREQMNAELPTNLSFVTIDGRLSNADLERKDSPKPAPVLESKQPEAPPQDVPTDAPMSAIPFFIPAPHSVFTKENTGNPMSLSRMLLIIQLVILFNACLVAAVFHVFGAPWEKYQPAQSVALQPAVLPKPQQKVMPHNVQPTEPFYRRNEYIDKYGVRHTVVEQLPYQPKPRPNTPKPAPPPNAFR